MKKVFGLPVFGFVGWSGSGKTTLLKELIGLFRASGKKVAVLKHAHHSFDLDQPGKDSYELRKAGATQVLVASSLRRALILETPQGGEPSLEALLELLVPQEADLVLVEGFKRASYPKLEVYRPSLGQVPLYPKDPDIIAVVSDQKLHLPDGLSLLDLNRPQEVFAFLVGRMEA
jgi:molybdopterin-guanine dinucleotide biosynthesis protein B